MGIVSFEIANLIVRLLTLKASLTAEDIAELREEVLLSEGVQTLVSHSEEELWRMAAQDKR